MRNQLLPPKYRDAYARNKEKIVARLKEFKAVPSSEYFYELCFCLLTPQSKAKNAFAAVERLKESNFQNEDIDPTPILKRQESYVRFHNVKAERLVEAKKSFPKAMEILSEGLSAAEEREKIIAVVKGFGFKEASHFLRNIGRENLGILDRHILKNLTALGVFKEVPNVSTKKRYLAAEKSFAAFAEKAEIPMDELDLLFWSMETGEIFK